MKNLRKVFVCSIVLIFILACCRERTSLDADISLSEQTPVETPSPAPTEKPEETQTPSPEPVSTETPELTPTEPPEVTTSETRIMYVADDGLRLRELPDLDTNILDILQRGQEVTLLSEENGWGLVSVNGIEGYVSMEFLSEEKPYEPEDNTDVNTDVEEIAVDNPDDSLPADIAAEEKATTGTGRKVAIDAGHQARGNNEQEPIGPGASVSKPKVASGTSGISTKVPEYQLTLEVSLKLRDELRSRGYEVYMVRESNDVNISNRERAIQSVEAGANILVRIHANGSENQGVSGILTISPSANNPYIPHLYQASYKLSGCILGEMVKSTGANSQGVAQMDNMSGINWSSIPVTIVEMGFMTNPAEDERMQQGDYQAKIVNGIANGIDLFFLE